MKQYAYILIDFLTVIVCFIFSFHPKIKFYKHFGAFIKAASLVAFPFIAWDVWFTRMGVWWFDSAYTLGLRIAGLPIEEWLFFICIPFACMFTYFCFEKFFEMNWTKKFNLPITLIASIICIVTAILVYHKIYPLVTSLATLATLLYLQFVVKATWIGKASIVYLILMLGFFPVNGVLTGTYIDGPIVNYNPLKILNIRMLTIPIEDAVYGFTQFLLNVYFFKLFQKKIPEDSLILNPTGYA